MKGDEAGGARWVSTGKAAMDPSLMHAPTGRDKTQDFPCETLTSRAPSPEQPKVTQRWSGKHPGAHTHTFFSCGQSDSHIAHSITLLSDMHTIHRVEVAVTHMRGACKHTSWQEGLGGYGNDQRREIPQLDQQAKIGSRYQGDKSALRLTLKPSHVKGEHKAACR